MAALTGVSATTALGTPTPVIRIGLTGVSASVVRGDLRNSTRPGESFTLTYPTIAFQLTGITGETGALSIAQPLPRIALTGTTPVAASLTLTAALPALQMTGVAGVLGALTLRTPTLAIQFGSGAALTLALPLPALRLTGAAGVTAVMALRPPAPALQLTGRTETIGTLTLTQRLPRLAMSMAVGQIGTIRRTVALPTLRMSGAAGTLGTLAIAQPLPELTFTGHFAAIGALAVTTPAIRLVMHGVTQGTTAQVAATRVTYALQTERQALTRYTNFPFNSFAVFGGRYLGASSDGIFELTGDTDAGVAIDAAARFGITDMNTSRVKRVDYVYIGARTAKGEKALLLRVTANETQQRDYGVKASISDGLHTTRVDLGMGVESRYWQFELRNRGGADFEVDTVDVMPTPQRRRLGAKDA